MKSYVAKIEIYSDDGLCAAVDAEDVCAKVMLVDLVHTVESWDELSAAIRAAIVQITAEEAQ
jgi:hypothetical protein